MLDKLDVYAWNHKLGSLSSYTERFNEKFLFIFSDEYRELGLNMAPIVAPMNGKRVLNGLPIYAESDKIYNNLPAFISDSLPDHWGNLVFAQWIKTRRLQLSKISPLDKLAYVGKRGMGALEFVPSAAPEMESSFTVDIAELFRLSEHTYNEAKNIRENINDGILVESLFRVGTSVGGRRPKAVINLNPKTGKCYSGQVASPDNGAIPMIIKFDETSDIPTTRIEYAYYLAACDAGMDMMPCSLIQDGKAMHFLTERFDRNGSKKIHTQTLAAIYPAAKTYEDLFTVSRHINIPDKEISQMFLQMVMNVLFCNVDDHNKNFSFLMSSKDGQWHKAPAYDFTFTVDISAPEYVNRHSMSINNKVSDIEREDLLTIARKYSIANADSIIDNAIEVAKNFNDYAQVAHLDSYWQEEINKRIKQDQLPPLQSR